MAVFTDEFIQQCRRFMELREKRDALKVAAKEANEDYEEAEADIWEELAPSDPTQKMASQKVPLGDPWGTVTFGPREVPYARVIDADKALEHYNNRALTEEVTSAKFVMKRLNEEVRECIEEGADLPPGLDFYKKRYVSITRPK